LASFSVFPEREWYKTRTCMASSSV